MKRTENFKTLLIEQLKDPQFAVGYLNECLQDKDDRVFLMGLRNVAEARGGIKPLAEKTGLNREHLFRLLSKKGNPTLETLRLLTKAFGWRFTLVPVYHETRKKAA